MRSNVVIIVLIQSPTLYTRHNNYYKEERKSSFLNRFLRNIAKYFELLLLTINLQTNYNHL